MIDKNCNQNTQFRHIARKVIQGHWTPCIQLLFFSKVRYSFDKGRTFYDPDKNSTSRPASTLTFNLGFRSKQNLSTKALCGWSMSVSWIGALIIQKGTSNHFKRTMIYEKIAFLSNKRIIYKIICRLNDHEHRHLCVDFGVSYPT